MGTQYYAEFLLHAGQAGDAEEYSGVVEFSDDTEVLEPRQIELLLAKTFQRSEQEIQLLGWSRLH